VAPGFLAAGQRKVVPRGRFITFEGGEGTGKSTQARRLSARLRELGISVVETREPGGSPAAELIRKIVLSGAAEPLGPSAEAMLFFSARDDHLETVIRPALERGDWVICDRFVDSTRAYQERAGKVSGELMRALERSVIGDTWPDLTIILDIDVETGLERARGQSGGAGDRFEDADLDFHKAIRTAFRAIARREPNRCVLVSAHREPDAVAEEIWKKVSDRFDLSEWTGEVAAAGASESGETDSE